MKKLFSLTKIYLKENISSFIGKKRGMGAKGLLLFAFLYVIIGVSMGANYYTMAESLAPINATSVILPMGIISATMVLVLINAKALGGNFYSAKDFETLSALPLKTSTVLGAKYISDVIISLVFSSVMLIPAYVVYFLFNKITFIRVFACVISLVLAPTFSQLLGCLIAWLTNLITSRMKNKNFINGMFSLVLVMAVLGASSIITNQTIVTVFMGEYPLWIKIAMPFIYFLDLAVIKESLLNLLFFIIVSLGYAFLAVFVMVIGYRKINSNLAVTKKSTKNKIYFAKKSVFCQMLKKDAKKFFTTPMYFVNVIVGPIFALIIPFVLLGLDGLLVMMLGEGNSLILLLGAFLIPLFLGMAPASASSISVEGTSFKLIKSLPVSHKDFLWSKVLFNILLNLPFLLIGEILTVVFLEVEILTALNVILIGLSALYFISLSSLFINLIFPVFEFSNVAQIVKQSKSVLLTMLLNIVINIIPIVVGANIITQTFTAELYLAICLAVFIILNVFLTVIFVKKSGCIYNKLN